MDTTLLARICDHANDTGFNPVLNALHVYETPTGNRAQAGNGRYILDVPTDLPPMTTPADKLLAALRACKAVPRLEIDGPNLLVKSGRMRVKLPLLESGSYPVATPDEARDSLLGAIGPLLARLLPFVASDASRPWATSVCLRNGFAYATNNVVIARLPFPFPHPESVNVPAVTVKAIVDNPEPERLGYSEGSLSLFYPDGTWLKTQLVQGDWPTEQVDSMFKAPVDWVAADEQLKGLLDTAAKLADDRHPVVTLAGDVVATEDGTFTVDGVTGLPMAPVKLNARMAADVFAVAGHVSWNTPRPSVHTWFQGNLLGVLAGVR